MPCLDSLQLAFPVAFATGSSGRRPRWHGVEISASLVVGAVHFAQTALFLLSNARNLRLVGVERRQSFFRRAFAGNAVELAISSAISATGMCQARSRLDPMPSAKSSHSSAWGRHFSRISFLPLLFRRTCWPAPHGAVRLLPGAGERRQIPGECLNVMVVMLCVLAQIVASQLHPPPMLCKTDGRANRTSRCMCPSCSKNSAVFMSLPWGAINIRMTTTDSK